MAGGIRDPIAPARLWQDDSGMTTRPTRRDVLSRAAFATAGLALSPALAPLLADEPKKPRFRIGICEWMLGKNDPSSIATAKDLGLDGVQVNMGSAGNDMHLRKPEVQKAYLETAKKHDVRISSIAIAEMNNIPLKADPRAEQWLADSIDVAKGLGVSVILIACFAKNDLKGDAKGTDKVVQILKQHAPRAEKEGKILGIESWLSAEEHADIMDRVGSPAVQCYYDLGNSHLKGYDIYKEIRWLGAKRICEFHAKDYNNVFGQGKVDFKEARKAMDDIGYSGWVQLEGAPPKGMSQADVNKANLAYLRKVFTPNT
jgi:sugar phosphate isomerase/epimerase